ncbi:MFS transporter [Streptomyces olindensis]|uniref:MFS transporter n=1 Tax=Streptomyces olindensis TaxID=358823 RepID=UPI0036575A55
MTALVMLRPLHCATQAALYRTIDIHYRSTANPPSRLLDVMHTGTYCPIYRSIGFIAMTRSGIALIDPEGSQPTDHAVAVLAADSPLELTVSSNAGPAAPEAAPPRRSARASFAAAIATSLEWYDFFIYSTAAALVFNTTFFATDNAVVSALSSFATVAVGFVARPVGGAVAGVLGDKHGRKPVLVGAMILMAVATSLIGFVPDTGVVWLAPTLLVMLRLCQGLAVGAQWSSAVLVATENAPAHLRGFFGSFAQLGVPIGAVLGNVVFLIATAVSSTEAFVSWVWRIPFWISLVMLPIAFAIHRFLEETPEFKAVAARAAAQPQVRRSVFLEAIRRNPGAILTAAGANTAGVVLFQVTIAGSVQFVTTYLGVGRTSALTWILIACTLMMPLVPFFGWLSDRYGRKLVFGLGAAAMMLWAVPMWLLIPAAGPDRVWPFGLAVIGAAIAMSLQTGTQGTLIAELFPPEVRSSGASLGYQIAGIIGGFGPFVTVALIDGDAANAWRVGALVAVLAAASLICLQLIIRRRYHSTPVHAPSGEAEVVAAR